MRIIPYQEIIGNYSIVQNPLILSRIIPYQEIIGNYSWLEGNYYKVDIIPYQEIIGNYSVAGAQLRLEELYHTKK